MAAKESARAILARLGREPLVHFVVLGTAVFGLHALLEGRVTDPSSDGRRPIVLSDRFVDALARRHAERAGSPPDTETQEGLVRDFVRQEALVREARRRGLGRGDPIVRRRLAQKMEFLIEGTVEVPEPSEDQLRAHLEQHPERFARPARVAFDHLFFSADERDHPRADAERALKAIEAEGAADGHAGRRGDPFLLGREQPLRPVERHARTFGRQFARTLAELEPERWHGPLESTLGWHLVRVTEREPASTPVLSEVRDRVRASWARARREEAYERAVEELVASYPVKREDGP